MLREKQTNQKIEREIFFSLLRSSLWKTIYKKKSNKKNISCFGNSFFSSNFLNYEVQQCNFERSQNLKNWEFIRHKS